MATNATIHPRNAHLVPALCFADYPTTQGTHSDALIVRRLTGQVLDRTLGVSEARRQLWTYPNRRAKLASFDRWLLDTLSNCADRACPFRA